MTNVNGQGGRFDGPMSRRAFLRTAAELTGVTAGLAIAAAVTTEPAHAAPAAEAVRSNAPLVTRFAQSALLLPDSVPAITVLAPDATPKATLVDAMGTYRGQLVHRLFKPNLHNAENKWGGCEAYGLLEGFHPEPYLNGVQPWENSLPGEFTYRLTNGTDGRIAQMWATESSYIAGMKVAGGVARPELPYQLSFRAFNEGTVVGFYDASGAKVHEQAVSPTGHDITLIVPDQGAGSVVFGLSDPQTTYEPWFHAGPYDRSAHINTYDGRSTMAR